MILISRPGAAWWTLFERRDGRWRVIKRTMIYEKDRMDPHKPGEVPESYFEAMDLTPYPKALRYHCWRNEKFSGSPPSVNLVMEGTEKAKAIQGRSAPLGSLIRR